MYICGKHNFVKTMNTYYFSFPFRGEYVYIKMDANMLANQLVNMMGVYDYTIEDGQYYAKTFTSKNPETGEYEEYSVDFNYENPYMFNVYKSHTDTYEEDLVEEGIPGQLLKVENNKGERLFDINDDL